MNHTTVPSDISKIKPESHPAQPSAGKLSKAKSPGNCCWLPLEGKAFSWNSCLHSWLRMDNCSDLLSPGGYPRQVILAGYPSLAAPGMAARGCVYTRCGWQVLHHHCFTWIAKVLLTFNHSQDSALSTLISSLFLHCIPTNQGFVL